MRQTWRAGRQPFALATTRVQRTPISAAPLRRAEMVLELDTSARDARAARAIEEATPEPIKKRSLKPWLFAFALGAAAMITYGAYKTYNSPASLQNETPTLEQITTAAEKMGEKVAASSPTEQRPSGMLRVTTKPANAEIFVDGNRIGESPLGIDNTFSAGPHDLVAKKKKKKKKKKKLVATAVFNGGEDVRLELKLTAIGKKPKKKR